MESGATAALHPDTALAEIASEGGVDVALEFVGRSSSVEGAVRSLDDGGRAVAGQLRRLPAKEGHRAGRDATSSRKCRLIKDFLGPGAVACPE